MGLAAGRLLRAVSPEGGDGVIVHQEAGVYVSSLLSGAPVSHKFEDGTGGYLYLIRGVVGLNGQALATGDAAKIWDEPEVTVDPDQESELILVEVRLEG